MAIPYKIKNYSDSFIYGAGDYEKRIYKFFMESKIVPKTGEAFDDIRFSVKKLSPSMCVADTLDSPNVVLLYHDDPTPRAFKVFTAKDLKSGDNKLKVFIDVSELISTKTGAITIDTRNIDKLVSYLTTALFMRIYYSYPDKIFNSSTLIKSGTKCFAELFTFIIDYLRLSGIERLREKCMYVGSLYCNMCIMGREYSSSVETLAKSISGISSKDIEVLDVMLPADMYKNIETFINGVATMLKVETLNRTNFIEAWVNRIGPGTQFGLEYFPALSSIITNVYNGSYIVTNQKLVEKVCGSEIVTYTKQLLSIGNNLK